MPRPTELRSDLRGFFRRLRVDVGQRFPYLWVPEWHPGGHGLHAHFVVGQYIRQRTIEAAWGQGWVHIKLLGDVPVGSGAIGEARLAARYVSKYIGKALGPSGGLHRYDVAEGFSPRVKRLRGATAEDVLDQASEIMGRRPIEIWDSVDDPTWTRPHAIWARWA